jgi:hypothetical protein
MDSKINTKNKVILSLAFVLIFAFSFIIYINYIFIKPPTVIIDNMIDVNKAGKLIEITNSDYYDFESTQLRDSNSFSSLFSLLVSSPTVVKKIYVSKVNLPNYGECYEVYYNVNYDNNYNETLPTKYFIDENFNIIRKKLLGKPIY